MLLFFLKKKHQETNEENAYRILETKDNKLDSNSQETQKKIKFFVDQTTAYLIKLIFFCSLQEKF